MATGTHNHMAGGQGQQLSPTMGPKIGPRIGPGHVQRQKMLQTPFMQLAMRVMAARLSYLRGYVREVAEDNPYLEAVVPAMPVSSAGAFEMDGLAVEAIRPMSLHLHVDGQINQIIPHADDRSLARQLVRYLSPAGWLDDSAEAEMAAAGYDSVDVARVIRLLQGMEPAGMFARGLAECIRLQLDDRGEADADTDVVLEHLDTLLDGGMTAATGLTDDRLAAAMGKIRRCTPKPGAIFQYDEGDIFTPDMVMTMGPEGVITVAVNHDDMPSLNVTADAAPDDDAGQILLAEAQREVSAITRAIKNRSEMLLAAGGILAQVQVNFLKKGEAHIAPYTMIMLSEQMGCHKSTISRLVADKLVQTPLGMLALSDLFASGIKQTDGTVRAGRAIKARIDALAIDGAGWSDQQMANHLKTDGITVARRTINKYRNAHLKG